MVAVNDQITSHYMYKIVNILYIFKNILNELLYISMVKKLYISLNLLSLNKTRKSVTVPQSRIYRESYCHAPNWK